MKFLIITNYKHEASKQFIKYLKLRRINFDHIDSSKKKTLRSKNTTLLILHFGQSLPFPVGSK